MSSGQQLQNWGSICVHRLLSGVLSICSEAKGVYKDGAFLLTFPGSTILVSRCGGKLKPILRLKLQAKYIGLLHRKTGTVF